MTKQLTPGEIVAFQQHVIRETFTLIDNGCGYAENVHFPVPSTEEIVASDPELAQRLAEFRRQRRLPHDPRL